MPVVLKKPALMVKDFRNFKDFGNLFFKNHKFIWCQKKIIIFAQY